MVTSSAANVTSSTGVTVSFNTEVIFLQSATTASVYSSAAAQVIALPFTFQMYGNSVSQMVTSSAANVTSSTGVTVNCNTEITFSQFAITASVCSPAALIVRDLPFTFQMYGNSFSQIVTSSAGKVVSLAGVTVNSRVLISTTQPAALVTSIGYVPASDNCSPFQG